MRSALATLVLSVSLLWLEPAHASERIQADHVRVSWIAPQQFAAGDQQAVGVLFQPDREWHVYWRNPGDSGAAPKIQLAATGAVVGEIQWPFPVRLPLGDLTNLGYAGDVALPFTLRPTADSVRVEAKLEWLVCRDVCIPGRGTLTLTRRAQDTQSRWGRGDRDLLLRFMSRVPSDSSRSPWKIAHAVQVADRLTVDLIRAGTDVPPELYPIDGQYVLPSRPEIERISGGFRARFRTLSGGTAPTSVGFVVVSDGQGWEHQGIALIGRPQELASEGRHSFWLLFLAAIAGGALLNLMPCVFPVLSIKALSFLRTQSHRGHLKESVYYTSGVLVTFVALGGVFLFLRAGGSLVGWGFHLQSPVVILFLCALFWLMALGFLGAIEMGAWLSSAAGRAMSERSSFMTGVLSVIVATPCTGPFMGTVLGASSTLPPVSAMLLFIGLGLGLALPLQLLVLFPSALRRLPRPGPWMETFKQFLAFPLFATVVWLLWVLGQQVGTAGWIYGTSLLWVISFSLWLARRSRLGWVAAWLLSGVALVASVLAMSSAGRSSHTGSSDNLWQVFTPSAVQMARSRSQAVFVDFTAAWCITCQWNKRTVLDTQRVTDAFKKNNAAVFRADWTHQDPVITNALRDLGRNSVPVYVFYPADGSAAKLLPQLLTVSMIETLF